MAYRRSNAFNADVNQALLQLIEGFQYDPYTVQAISGYRPGDKRQHGRGNAIDIEMIDPKTGQRLGNYQDPRTFGAYQQYANALYQHALQTNPELAQKLRWGGYFSGGPGKYGALDLMHFDVAGGQGGIPMGGGSWEGGLTPEQAKIWGLQAGMGGAGGGGVANADLTPQQQWMAGLWQHAQAVSQKTGVDPRLIMAQTALETGYGKSAPNNAYFGIKGKGSDQKTLEFINGKMTPVQASFRAYASPQESFEDYGNLLMGGRYAGVREAKGLEAQIAAMGKAGYATDPDYATKLLAIAQGIPEGGYGAAPADSPSESAGGPGTTLGTPAAAAADKNKPWWKKMLGGMAEAATNFGDQKQAAIAPLAPSPAAAVVRGQPMSPIDPQTEELKRQQLAQAMARLNAGKLWG